MFPPTHNLASIHVVLLWNNLRPYLSFHSYRSVITLLCQKHGPRCGRTTNDKHSIEFPYLREQVKTTEVESDCAEI